MITKQVRIDPDIKCRIKIQAVKSGMTINGLINSVLQDPDNWQISFTHKRSKMKYKQGFVVGMTLDHKATFNARADKVRAFMAGKEELKITDEMIINQILENKFK